MKTIYKLMLCKRTSRYRIMVYTPISSNSHVRFTHTWTDDNGQLFNMNWLQTSNTPLSIVQFDSEEVAKIAIDDLQRVYDMDKYIDVSCST